MDVYISAIFFTKYVVMTLAQYPFFVLYYNLLLTDFNFATTDVKYFIPEIEDQSSSVQYILDGMLKFNMNVVIRVDPNVTSQLRNVFHYKIIIGEIVYDLIVPQRHEKRTAPEFQLIYRIFQKVVYIGIQYYYILVLYLLFYYFKHVV